MNIKQLAVEENPDGPRRLTVRDIKEAVANGTVDQDREIKEALEKMTAIRETAVRKLRPVLEPPEPLLIRPLRPITSDQMSSLLDRERHANKPMNLWVKIGIVSGVVAAIVAIAALVVAILAYRAVH